MKREYKIITTADAVPVAEQTETALLLDNSGMERYDKITIQYNFEVK